MEEIAQTLDVSTITVRRDLRLAEAWLHQQIVKEQVAAMNEFGGGSRMSKYLAG